MKLEHVAINVAEPAKLAAWLIKNCGMRLVLEVKEPPFMHFVADDAGSMIELYCNTTVPLPDYSKIDPFNLHFAFTTIAAIGMFNCRGNRKEVDYENNPTLDHCGYGSIHGFSTQFICCAV